MSALKPLSNCLLELLSVSTNLTADVSSKMLEFVTFIFLTFGNADQIF